jgi:N-acetylated-alpha-linked acidic dipeptidase
MPIGLQRLALLQGSEVLYEAPLVDDPENKHGYREGGFMPAYFGFSANANITASYVFANFGRAEDFDTLEQANVSLAGRIAVVKSTNVAPYMLLHRLVVFRGEQIQNAEERGMAGVLVYTDPGSDQPINEANGYKPYPEGPARPGTAIERGAVRNIDHYRNGRVPSIPCLPISYADATAILKVLNGHGPSAFDLGSSWKSGGLAVYGVDYNVGPSPADISINLVNQADIVSSQVHNVIGVIPGAIPDEVVILGNHRDSWSHGAGDPNSGSAALNEVVRSFGVALSHGWRPRRTIVFASWEGEELGQVGSGSWVRDHLTSINATTIAYLNVVVAASGRSFHVKASPLLYGAAFDATRRIQSPNQTILGQSVLDVWDGELGRPGGGDANMFLGLACVPTVDFGFSAGLGDVFPYHSGSDNFEWMDRYGDPGFQYHVTSAKIWSMMTVYLTERVVLNMSVGSYATALREWLDELLSNRSFDGAMLYSAVERLGVAATRFDAYAASLTCQRSSWWRFWDRGLVTAIREVNQRYIAFERAFYYPDGLEKKPNFHHALYGAQSWHTQAPAFPEFRQSLDSGNLTNAEVSLTADSKIAPRYFNADQSRNGDMYWWRESMPRQRCWSQTTQINLN